MAAMGKTVSLLGKKNKNVKLQQQLMSPNNESEWQAIDGPLTKACPDSWSAKKATRPHTLKCPTQRRDSTHTYTQSPFVFTGV